ncbi:hypothetical protein EVAR_65580_1 [Eumeta japonica]|uniref:Uncharacterized protein n=1 Tax=Eumeta variegata TaxID=151549 RepID=A0A4C1Z4G5_EUMVA|nr:hypothetical protein EVAR_65580_1 [Eumeta japonica]
MRPSARAIRGARLTFFRAKPPSHSLVARAGSGSLRKGGETKNPQRNFILWNYRISFPRIDRRGARPSRRADAGSSARFASKQPPLGRRRTAPSAAPTSP